jgi:hypothetical protein
MLFHAKLPFPYFKTELTCIATMNQKVNGILLQYKEFQEKKCEAEATNGWIIVCRWEGTVVSIAKNDLAVKLEKLRSRADTSNFSYIGSTWRRKRFLSIYHHHE